MRTSTITVFLALLGLSWAAPVQANTQEEWDHYNGSAYDFCDAKVLGAHWGESEKDAKYRIGRKIGWGDQSILEEALADARAQALSAGTPTCTIQEAGYDYQDAEALARTWNKSIDDTKTHMVNKIFWGNEDLLQKELQAAQTPPSDPESNIDYSGSPLQSPSERNAYDVSAYDYCDAKVLGAHWGESTTDAKYRIGWKIGRSEQSTVESNLAAARSQALSAGTPTCTIQEVGYTYKDAEILAVAWNKSVDEAKTTMVTKVFWGNEAILRQELRAARSAASKRQRVRTPRR